MGDIKSKMEQLEQLTLKEVKELRAMLNKWGKPKEE
jgi:hypothetical protein